MPPRLFHNQENMSYLLCHRETTMTSRSKMLLSMYWWMRSSKICEQQHASWSTKSVYRRHPLSSCYFFVVSSSTRDTIQNLVIMSKDWYGLDSHATPHLKVRIATFAIFIVKWLTRRRIIRKVIVTFNIQTDEILVRIKYIPNSNITTHTTTELIKYHITWNHNFSQFTIPKLVCLTALRIPKKQCFSSSGIQLSHFLLWQSVPAFRPKYSDVTNVRSLAHPRVVRSRIRW